MLQYGIIRSTMDELRIIVHSRSPLQTGFVGSNEKTIRASDKNQ